MKTKAKIYVCFQGQPIGYSVQYAPDKKTAQMLIDKNIMPPLKRGYTYQVA